jgi:phosphate-selective porin
VKYIPFKNFILFLLIGPLGIVYAGENDSTKSKKRNPQIQVKYGSKGWEFSTPDGNYKLQFQSRLQFRFSIPFDIDPVTFDEFQQTEKKTFRINRARLKIGGNVYRPWLKYYWEYELAASVLLTFRMIIAKYPFLSFKVGQWKAQYNRERIISSGKQQMMDRSLVTRPFTIDRQQGVSLFGRLKKSKIADFNYWISAFTGTGRGGGTNDDTNLMFMARGQWNFFGREVPFQGSDTKYHNKPVALIAFAAVTNRSPYTRFSTAGGGELEGFEPGEAGQYRANQWMEESALMYKGFSWQQEFHWKEINDKVNKKITTLIGNYVQFGYFLHHLISAVPKPLEIAVRHSIYYPDRTQKNYYEREFSLVGNWFFKEHLNKLSIEISHLDFQRDIDNMVDGTRFRVQWDVSI